MKAMGRKKYSITSELDGGRVLWLYNRSVLPDPMDLTELLNRSELRRIARLLNRAGIKYRVGTHPFPIRDEDRPSWNMAGFLKPFPREKGRGHDGGIYSCVSV